MGRFRNQWEQVRGNFKYEILRTSVFWFVSKFGASVIATLTAVTSFILGHREMALLIGVPAAYWVLQGIITWILPKKLNLRFVPHGDNSPNVCLEVFNDNAMTKISARIRVLSRSYGQGVKQYGYDGVWVGPDFSLNNRKHLPTQGHNTSVKVAKGKSENLLIATIRERLHGQLTLDLMGIEEKLMWDFESKSDSPPLPHFVLQIEFFGEGVDKPVPKIYRLGPKHSYGPVGMEEVRP
jgi:hypothetical protein